MSALPGTVLEAALRRERAIVAAGLAGIVALSWAYLIPASLDMYGSMDGLAAWMMAATWDARYFTLIFLMWCVMMIGMMLPSAAPTILLYARTVRSSAQAQTPIARAYAFTAGYLAAWTAFSLMATLLQWLLAEAALLSPMMESANAVLGASILIAAGLYQWMPLKQQCLAHCRSPVRWLTQHWRPGAAGAMHMGISHGLFCLGCCWALMLLLFFGGVMNLLWIALIAAFVFVEKLTPHGAHAGRIGGVLLVGAGMWMLV